MTFLPPASITGGLPVAAVIGGVVGWLAVLTVRRLASDAGVSARRSRVDSAVVAALAAAAAGLWWWEVDARGQLPSAATGVSPEWLAARWLGHVVFLGFLAAAAWIDLRERVIPDAITVPGVLVGLAWAGFAPAALPPVARQVPRSFAAPTVVPDVLTLAGPLGGDGLPAWLEAAPSAAGLAVAMALFLAWWLTCTAPAEAGPSGRRSLDPRLPVLAVGLVGIGAAWWRGAGHWSAVLSALVGLATGVAVVWATRIGASRALGREALGFGDVTLVAVIGAWLGWQGTFLACCIGVLVGLAHGLAQLVRGRGNELPFGPSLCLGAVLVIVLWRPLWEWAEPAFARPQEIAVVAAVVIILTAITLAAWWRLSGRSPA